MGEEKAGRAGEERIFPRICPPGAVFKGWGKRERGASDQDVDPGAAGGVCVLFRFGGFPFGRDSLRWAPGYGWPREDAEKRAEEAIAGFRG